MSSPRARFTLRNRSVYFWLNLGFVIIVLGMVFGAGDQGWYLLVAIAWLIVGTVQTVRSRKAQPRTQNLFDDESHEPRAHD